MRRSLELLLLLACVPLLVAAPGCRSALGGGDAPAEPDHLAQPIGPPPPIAAWSDPPPRGRVLRIEADPAAGFHWPYFLTLPEGDLAGRPLLVQPNNDGRSGAPFETHLYWASILNEQLHVDYGRDLGSVCLTPVFPRPLDDRGRNLYVHALSREALANDQPELARPDLQLLAMLDDARARLAASGVDTPPDALFWGFSAAGDFVTRMWALHPDRVRAVAAGGLGGLPILPLGRYRRAPLTYPVGIGDLEALTGRAFDSAGFRATPALLLQGGADENDSVPEGELDREGFWSDSYDYDQTVWINANFGRLPAKRVDQVRAIFDGFGCEDFEYELWPDVEHTTSPEMEARVRAFLAERAGT